MPDTLKRCHEQKLERCHAIRVIKSLCCIGSSVSLSPLKCISSTQPLLCPHYYLVFLPMSLQWSNLFFFKDFIYLLMRDTERGRDTGRGRSRLHAGSPTRTRSRITPLAEGSAKPLNHLGCPYIFILMMGNLNKRYNDLSKVTQLVSDRLQRQTVVGRKCTNNPQNLCMLPYMMART